MRGLKTCIYRLKFRRSIRHRAIDKHISMATVASEDEMIRLADYIFSELAARGLSDVFLVTGGGAMHLNDAIAREPRLRYLCNHHEQASAIAAEGYARVAGKPAILN